MGILVIEDEKKTAAFLAKGLHEAGFVVDVAPDGEAGLAATRASKFDLLIVDIMLPKKDGWALVEELRRGGKADVVPVLRLVRVARARVGGPASRARLHLAGEAIVRRLRAEDMEERIEER